RALVLESPFTSIADMAAVALPLLPMRYFVRTRYDNLAKIAALKVPLLVLHGEADTTVPLEQGRRVFEAAPEPKRFFAIPAAGHSLAARSRRVAGAARMRPQVLLEATWSGTSTKGNNVAMSGSLSMVL